MEVNDDAGVHADTFHCLAVYVGCTSSALKQIGQPWTHRGFFPAHYVFYVTQGGALRRGQANKLGIVWFHRGLVGRL